MMNMQKNSKRILLFDIDGTLIDLTYEDTACLKRALESVYGQAGPINNYRMSGKTHWRIITDLMQLAGLDPGTIDVSLQDAFGAYSQQVEMAQTAFSLLMLPGVIALLNQLSAHPDFLLGLVTGNVREAAFHKLQHAGINPGLFTFGAFGSEHIDRNQLPALALYRLEQQLGIPIAPESAIVIGDTPADIACARHAGVQAMGVATGPYSRQALADHAPDFLFDDLADTQAVMKTLASF